MTPENLWYVRSYFIEAEHEAYLDEGPWDLVTADLVLADIGVDASIPRGIGRVTVKRAILVSAEKFGWRTPDPWVDRAIVVAQSSADERTNGA